jgi:hypothetical protein
MFSVSLLFGDKLVLGSDGRVQRVPRVPKEAETKVKEEIKD